MVKVKSIINNIDERAIEIDGILYDMLFDKDKITNDILEKRIYKICAGIDTDYDTKICISTK